MQEFGTHVMEQAGRSLIYICHIAHSPEAIHSIPRISSTGQAGIVRDAGEESLVDSLLFYCIALETVRW